MVCLVLGFVVSYGRYTHVFTYTVNPFEFVLTSMKETNVSIMLLMFYVSGLSVCI
jgi:hypothetical protein